MVGLPQLPGTGIERGRVGPIGHRSPFRADQKPFSFCGLAAQRDVP
jgi:hypothetical protein